MNYRGQNIHHAYGNQQRYRFSGNYSEAVIGQHQSESQLHWTSTHHMSERGPASSSSRFQNNQGPNIGQWNQIQRFDQAGNVGHRNQMQGQFDGRNVHNKPVALMDIQLQGNFNWNPRARNTTNCVMREDQYNYSHMNYTGEYIETNYSLYTQPLAGPQMYQQYQQPHTEQSAITPRNQRSFSPYSQQSGIDKWHNKNNPPNTLQSAKAHKNEKNHQPYIQQSRVVKEDQKDDTRQLAVVKRDQKDNTRQLTVVKRDQKDNTRQLTVVRRDQKDIPISSQELTVVRKDKKNNPPDKQQSKVVKRDQKNNALNKQHSTSTQKERKASDHVEGQKIAESKQSQETSGLVQGQKTSSSEQGNSKPSVTHVHSQKSSSCENGQKTSVNEIVQKTANTGSQQSQENSGLVQGQKTSGSEQVQKSSSLVQVQKSSSNEAVQKTSNRKQSQETSGIVQGMKTSFSEVVQKTSTSNHSQKRSSLVQSQKMPSCEHVQRNSGCPQGQHTASDHVGQVTKETEGHPSAKMSSGLLSKETTKSMLDIESGVDHVIGLSKMDVTEVQDTHINKTTSGRKGSQIGSVVHQLKRVSLCAEAIKDKITKQIDDDSWNKKLKGEQKTGNQITSDTRTQCSHVLDSSKKDHRSSAMNLNASNNALDSRCSLSKPTHDVHSGHISQSLNVSNQPMSRHNLQNQNKDKLTDTNCKSSNSQVKSCDQSSGELGKNADNRQKSNDHHGDRYRARSQSTEPRREEIVVHGSTRKDSFRMQSHTQSSISPGHRSLSQERDHIRQYQRSASEPAQSEVRTPENARSYREYREAKQRQEEERARSDRREKAVNSSSYPHDNKDYRRRSLHDSSFHSSDTSLNRKSTFHTDSSGKKRHASGEVIRPTTTKPTSSVIVDKETAYQGTSKVYKHSSYFGPNHRPEEDSGKLSGVNKDKPLPGSGLGQLYTLGRNVSGSLINSGKGYSSVNSDSRKSMHFSPQVKSNSTDSYKMPDSSHSKSAHFVDSRRSSDSLLSKNLMDTSLSSISILDQTGQQDDQRKFADYSKNFPKKSVHNDKVSSSIPAGKDDSESRSISKESGESRSTVNDGVESRSTVKDSVESMSVGKDTGGSRSTDKNSGESRSTVEECNETRSRGKECDESRSADKNDGERRSTQLPEKESERFGSTNVMEECRTKSGECSTNQISAQMSQQSDHIGHFYGSDLDIDLDESDDELEVPSFLVDLENACNRPVPGTPPLTIFHSPTPGSPVPFRSDVNPPKLHSSYFSLDGLLAERTEKSEEQREIEEIHAELEKELILGGFVKDTLEKVEEPRKDELLPEHQVQLQQFEVSKSVLCETHPGETIFQPSLHQRLFNSMLPLQLCGFVPGTSYVDKYLSTAQPNDYSNIFTSDVLVQCMENVSCPESVLRWVLLVMSVESSHLAMNGCFRILEEYLFCQKTFYYQDLTTTWTPDINDILAILCNCGCEIETLLPSEISGVDEPLRQNMIQQSSTDIVPPNVPYNRENIRLVLQVLTLALQAKPRYMTVQLTQLLIMLFKASLDKSLTNGLLMLEFETSIDSVLRCYSEAAWDAEVLNLCVTLPSLTSHHHNKVYLAQLLPPGTRGSYLRQRVCFRMLQQTFNMNCDSAEELKQFKIKMLHQFLPLMQNTVKEDVYKLASCVNLLDMCVGNSSIKSAEKDDLSFLTEQLRKISGDVRDNVCMLDRTRVKDLMVRVTSKWTLILMTVESKQKSIFAYAKVMSPQKFKIETLKDSQSDNESDHCSHSDMEHSDAETEVVHMETEKTIA